MFRLLIAFPSERVRGRDGDADLDHVMAAMLYDRDLFLTMDEVIYSLYGFVAIRIVQLSS